MLLHVIIVSKSKDTEERMRSTLNRIMLYAKDVQATCAFYERHFGFECKFDPDGRIAELVSPHGGAIIMVHQAGKGLKSGQASVKLVFDIEDIEGFKDQCARRGLEFGASHGADGYSFANAKDPDGNSISISSRGFATK
ncbi:lactoylglutathione lyase [Burkholderia aenigmatica]|uniref:Lactoylglutathione lyase n=1 Tax=Burkholderia aenigmatica TaxID=2015348 RepID=A0ABY6XR00_9BURK|nr:MULTISPECIES: VOC family protein [Burkholderia]VWC67050.1 lactoylglutathione lyase [Burkholderia aenigmatica]VWC91373.1 lactoylglutathione lyase [Burkholderia aenigmatica]